MPSAPERRRPSVPPYAMERMGVVMEPRPGDPLEAWGVLNPACARDRDGELYLFPRLVADGNVSRIGRARVIFDASGVPCGVERVEVVLEPVECWELHDVGGVEDPRITFVPRLDRYVMAYTAFGPSAPGSPLRSPSTSRLGAAWSRVIRL